VIDDSDRYQVCPECAGEYRIEIERCADCDIPLTSPEEIAHRNARELLLVSGLHALRTAPIPWVRALAADLAAEGIPYGVDRSQARSEGLLTLFVRRADRGAAAVVDAARARTEAPLYLEEDEIEGEAEEPSNVTPFPREPADHKICPQCGGEYRLEIETCADCGVPLVFPGDAPVEAVVKGRSGERYEGPISGGGAPVTLPIFALPQSDDLVCISCRPAPALSFLSRKLDAAGVPHRIDPASYGRNPEIGCLYTLPEDGDAAAAVDAEHFGGSPVDEVDLAELAICPACGTENPPEILECGGCGLRLGAEAVVVDPTCERCGAVVATEAGSRCPNCGARLPAA
jgi:hypothetical protein